MQTIKVGTGAPSTEHFMQRRMTGRSGIRSQKRSGRMILQPIINWFDGLRVSHASVPLESVQNLSTRTAKAITATHQSSMKVNIIVGVVAKSLIQTACQRIFININN